MLVHHYLEFYARNTPDSPCVSHHETSMSFSEVNAGANQLGNGFLQAGRTERARSQSWARNSIEHCLFSWPPAKWGAVAVPLNYRLAPAELAYIIGDSGTRYCWFWRAWKRRSPRCAPTAARHGHYHSRPARQPAPG